MAATIMMKETTQMAGLGGVETPQADSNSTNVVFAKCECCGLTEECTEEYVSRVRARHQGRWICGLCGEAVKDEIMRSARRIGTEEALNRHMSFCRKASTPPPNPNEELILAVKQLLLRSLDSPHTSPLRKDFMRSQSCMPALDA